MKRTSRRSDCPISFALEIFGDSWSLLVIRDLMFRGKTTYSDFLRSEESIATNVLASRLRHLVDRGLIRRRRVPNGVAYALTAKGIELLPAVVELIDWSARYDSRTGADPAFVARIRTDKARLLAELRANLRRDHAIDESGARSRRAAAQL